MASTIEFSGWFLDVYPDETGVTVWVLGEDGERHSFRQPFPVTFYASGPFPRLRQLWRYLRDTALGVALGRTQREDLFSGSIDVLEIRAATPAIQQRLLRDLLERFPDLDYFDADIPLALRYTAAFGLFPLGRCRVAAGPNGDLYDVAPLDSPWDLDADRPPLRIMTVEPDTDPSRREPTCLQLVAEQGQMQFGLDPPHLLLISVQAALKRFDPDIVLTRWGDTWLFPHLFAIQHKLNAAYFNPNRDPARQPLRRKANSYFTYGQVVYRGQQVHLYGRWHIDRANAMMFNEYGLEGVFEQARVTGLPVQEIARKSPGAGITAMQMLVALRRGVLVPHQKQQAERFKSARDLIRADRGGLVYQPTVGVHRDVAEIDFVSMYPSIMAKYNISPETVGVHAEGAAIIPELGIPVDQSREGLVPATLKPLLTKRIALKQRMAGMNPHDCRYKSLKARSAALKWLLVVCFGYLGYKNARFGRIEGHEAVTAYSRELLLRAKEAAEDAGYAVLHMYVDGLWLKQDQETAASVQAVMDDIMVRTGLPIALEGIYRFIVFLPSRMDERVPVANRYYGVFRDGSLKTRGIAVRRHDTPPFVARVQTEILQQLAGAGSAQPPETQLPAIVDLLGSRLGELRAGRIQTAELLVTHRVSRTLEDYKGTSPAARAMEQLGAAGKSLRPGQYVRFVYTCGQPGVHAWDLPTPPDPQSVDTRRYSDLLLRAASSVLQPFIGDAQLRSRIAGGGEQLALPDPRRIVDSRPGRAGSSVRHGIQGRNENGRTL